MVRHIQLEPTKLDATDFLSPGKRINDEHFAGLFMEARVDAAQQSSSKVERRMQRDRQDVIHSERSISDEIFSDNDLAEVPAEDDFVSEESPPSGSSDSETSENDQEIQDTDENTAVNDASDLDDDPESDEQDKTNVVLNEINSAVAQTQNYQQVLLSGLAAQANAKTAQQQLATQHTQPQANSQPGSSAAEQAGATPLPNQQPEKINVKTIRQQVNQTLPKQPEQNIPLPPTQMPTDTAELNANAPKVIGIQLQPESQVVEEAVIKPEVEKPTNQTLPEVAVQTEAKKQSEIPILNQNDPASEENDKPNRSRPDLITKLNKTDKSVEVTVAHSDTSKQKGFEFTKQNQGQHNLAVTAKTHTSASVEKVSDLQNLPEMKSPGSVQTSDAADRQENVDRIVRAARTAQTRGASRIQIRLEPPELGTLRIEIKQSSNGLNMQLQATNLKAQQILQQSSNELRAALEAQGLQPRQIDIQLRLDLRNDQTPNQQQNHNPSSQSGSQGQSQGQGQQELDSEPFLLWQDWQAEPESEQVASQSTPAPKWQSLDFNALDVRV